MKVVKWIPYNEAVKLPEAPIGGMGGWFSDGDRWKDYLSEDEKNKEYQEALRQSIIENGIRKGGFWHQDEKEDGCPLFEDGTSATFSMRAWGDLLASIWSEEENTDYCYVDFAWTDGPNPIPFPKDINEKE